VDNNRSKLSDKPVLDGLLHLFEGARLDLAHALARHTEFVS
jgi:hypothetical protein